MIEFAAAPNLARQRRPGLSARAGAVIWVLLLGYISIVLLWSNLDFSLMAACIYQYARLAGWAAVLVYFNYRCAYAFGYLHHIQPRQAERWLLLGAASAALTLVGYAVFKQLILPDRAFVFDRLLAGMGRLALNGHLPWEMTHAVFGSVWATLLIDRLYSLWLFPFFIFPMAAMVLAPTLAKRAQMLLAWILAVVLIGTVGAWVFASAGPCYFNALIGPDPGFAALDMRLDELNRQAHALGTQLNAVDFQSVLLERYRARDFGPAGGISAMPSMHVAMATLFALAGHAIRPKLGFLLTGYMGLIWIGSIHLGWHYGVDGPVAMLMMLGIWRLSGRIVERLTASSEPAHSHSIVPGGFEVKS